MARHLEVTPRDELVVQHEIVACIFADGEGLSACSLCTFSLWPCRTRDLRGHHLEVGLRRQLGACAPTWVASRSTWPPASRKTARHWPSAMSAPSVSVDLRLSSCRRPRALAREILSGCRPRLRGRARRAAARPRGRGSPRRSSRRARAPVRAALEGEPQDLFAPTEEDKLAMELAPTTGPATTHRLLPVQAVAGISESEGIAHFPTEFDAASARRRSSRQSQSRSPSSWRSGRMQLLHDASGPADGGAPRRSRRRAPGWWTTAAATDRRGNHRGAAQLQQLPRHRRPRGEPGGEARARRSDPAEQQVRPGLDSGHGPAASSGSSETGRSWPR